MGRPSRTTYRPEGRWEIARRGVRLLIKEPKLALFVLRHRSRREFYQEYLRLESEREPWRSIKERTLQKPNQVFRFQGEEYRYEYHETNQTWFGERGVELALGWRIVRAHADRRILEVGNVLSQYYPVPTDFTIVDKYERRPGILNVDLVDFDPPRRFGLVVSISTMEHIGWDEHPRTPEKLLLAVRRIRTLLDPDGRALVTVPVGYNPFLDGLLRTGRHGFDQVAFMKRVSWDNTWREVGLAELEGIGYGGEARFAEVLRKELYPSANALAICSIEPGTARG